MSSLRARAFVAIAVAVLVTVAVTLIVAAVVVRQSVRDNALDSLARQTALIAQQQRSRPVSSLGEFFTTKDQQLTIVSLPQALLLLPPSGAEALREGREAKGSINVNGHSYLYAAGRSGDQVVILLRLSSLDWQPFWIAFAIAAGVGALLAALVAYLLAGAVARPIRRVATASRQLAAGERPEPLPVTG